MLDCRTGPRTKLDFIKYNQRTSLFTTAWARCKFASVIQFKILKECIQIIQIEIEKLHHLRAGLTEVYKDI